MTQQPVNLAIRDPKVMRAMAHPARLAILEHLSGGRQATATECAQVCGLSPSATSYHLRELAKAGLVEEAPGRGDGRERVWQAAERGYRLDVDQNSEEHVSAALAFVEVMLARDDEQTRRWFARARDESKDWYDAAGIVRQQLVMTPDELSALFDAVTKLMRPYSRAERTDPPEGARTVAATFKAIPAEPPP